MLLVAGAVTGVLVMTRGKSVGANTAQYINATLEQMLVPPAAMPGFTAISNVGIEDAASSLNEPGSIASLPCFSGALQSDPQQQAAAATGFVQNSTGMGILEALASFPSLKETSAKFGEGEKKIRRCSNFTFNYAGVPLSITLTRMSFPAVTKVLQAFRFTVSGQGITIGYDVIIAQRSTVDVALFMGPTDPRSPSVVSFARKALQRITGAPGVVDIGANNTSGPCTASGNVDYIQAGVAPGGPTYVVPSGAIAIRSWSIAAGATGGVAQLEVWQRQSATNEYLFLAAGPAENLSVNRINTFKLDLRVRPGDVIGLGQDSPLLACGLVTDNPADDWESDSGLSNPWQGFDAPSYRFLVFPQGPFPFSQDGDLQLNVSADLLVTKSGDLHPYAP